MPVTPIQCAYMVNGHNDPKNYISIYFDKTHMQTDAHLIALRFVCVDIYLEISKSDQRLPTKNVCPNMQYARALFMLFIALKYA